jgi:hypothetical protein
VQDRTDEMSAAAAAVARPRPRLLRGRHKRRGRRMCPRDHRRSRHRGSREWRRRRRSSINGTVVGGIRMSFRCRCRSSRSQRRRLRRRLVLVDDRVRYVVAAPRRGRDDEQCRCRIMCAVAASRCHGRRWLRCRAWWRCGVERKTGSRSRSFWLTMYLTERAVESPSPPPAVLLPRNNRKPQRSGIGSVVLSLPLGRSVGRHHH